MGTLQRQVDSSRVTLPAELVVGRMQSSGLLLQEAYVSTAHALIRWNGRDWEIKDLGSTNGTYLDGGLLEIGRAKRLECGSTVAFGDAREAWMLMEDSAPVPRVVSLGDGESCSLVSGVIPVPSAEEPACTIYFETGQWVLETHESRVLLSPGQQFLFGGKAWRLECPSCGAPTNIARRSSYLADVTISFFVSSDQEHVVLKVRHGQHETSLGERKFFFLAFVLARRRLDDLNARVVEPGWVDVEEISKMIPEYTSSQQLNVDICRFRKLLFEAGVCDGARIVERRLGQLRFGTDKAETHAADD